MSCDGKHRSLTVPMRKLKLDARCGAADVNCIHLASKDTYSNQRGAVTNVAVHRCLTLFWSHEPLPSCMVLIRLLPSVIVMCLNVVRPQRILHAMKRFRVCLMPFKTTPDGDLHSMACVADVCTSGCSHWDGYSCCDSRTQAGGC